MNPGGGKISNADHDDVANHLMKLGRTWNW
jgi:hypothetical protein